MRFLRIIISLIIIGALGLFIYRDLPRDFFVKLSDSIGWQVYIVYTLAVILYFLVMEIILSKLGTIIGWLIEQIIGLVYGIGGSEAKDKRKQAKRAFWDVMLGRRDMAATYYTNAGLHKQAAACYERIQDYLSAAESYSAAGEYMRAALMFENAEKFESAAECHKKTNNRAATISCINKAADQLAGLGKPLIAAEILMKNHLYRRAGDFFEMSGYARRAAEAYECDGDLLTAARLYLKAAQERSASQQKKVLYDKSAPSDRELETCARKAGKIFESQGYAHEARQAYELIGMADKAAGLYINEGRIADAAKTYSQAEMWKEARECYEKMNDTKQVCRMDAQIALEAGDFRKAGSFFEQAGDLPKAFEMYHRLNDPAAQAHCLELMNRPLAAANQYSLARNFYKAAELYEAAGSLTEAAEIYQQLGMNDKAARCLSEAGNPYYLALLEKQKGNIEGAAEKLRFITQAEPVYEKAMLLLGSCYYEMDKFHLAAEAYERVFHNLKPVESNVEIFYTYARALESNRNITRALEVYQKIQSIHEGYKDAEERIQNLLKPYPSRQKKTLDQMAKNRRGEGVPLLSDRMKPPTPMEPQPTVHEDQQTIFENQKTVFDEQKTVIEERQTIIEDDKTIIEDLKTVVEDQKTIIDEAPPTIFEDAPETMFDAGDSESETVDST